MTDLDAFLDALEKKLRSYPWHLTPGALAGILSEARAKLDAEEAEPAAIYDNITPWLGPSEPAAVERWSDWVRHRQGDPCPVPPNTKVETRKGDEQVWPGQAVYVPWHCVTSFRYLADNPAGWLPRGDWIPPAELWRDDCPVRCEWRAADAGGVQSAGSCQPRNWHTITHIRLVAREIAEATQPEPAAVPELPEWLILDGHGDWAVQLGDGRRFWLDPNLNAEDLDRIAEACRILAARRRAWL